MYYPEPVARDFGKRDITHVFGKTGSGKTTFLREHLITIPRVIFYDPMEEFWGPVAEEPEELIDYISRHERFAIRYREPEDFPLLCEIAKEAGNVTLAIEEAESIIPPSREKLDPFLRELIFRGRHYNVSLLFSAQRPSTVHIHARSQWTRLVSFHQSEPADVSWLEQTGGFRSEGNLDLRSLQVPGHYLDIRPGNIERKETKILPLSVLRRKGGRERESKGFDLSACMST